MTEAVNHPKHYNSHPSGIEAIEIARHLDFDLGNALKYVWRSGEKIDAIEDLKKAGWYLTDAAKAKQPLRISRKYRTYLFALVATYYHSEYSSLKCEAIGCIVKAATAKKRHLRMLYLGTATGIVQTMITNLEGEQDEAVN